MLVIVGDDDMLVIVDDDDASKQGYQKEARESDYLYPSLEYNQLKKHNDEAQSSYLTTMMMIATTV